MLPLDTLLLLTSAFMAPFALAAAVPFVLLYLGIAYGLHRRRLWAWTWNWAMVGLTYLLLIDPTSALGLSVSSIEGAGLIYPLRLAFYALIWIWPNYIYWMKRKALFSS